MNAYRVYLWYAALTALGYGLTFTVSAYFLVETVGLNPLQLVLIGTVLEGTIFLFEIPTGVVADVISRRLSIIVGVAIIGLGLMLYGVPNFYVILLGQALWGLGYTFTSGATEAWITDEIGEAQAGAAFLRGSQVGQAVGIVAIPLSVALALVQVNLPMLLGGLVMLGQALFLALVMREQGFQPTPREQRNTWAEMRQTTAAGLGMLKRRPVLVPILWIAFVFGAFSEGYDRLWGKHLLDGFSLPQIANLDAVVWFGIIGMIGSLLSITITEGVRRRLDTQHYAPIVRSLTLLSGLLVLGMLAFTFAGQLALALLAIWLIGVVRSLIHPLYTAWLNQGLDARVRATVISLQGQADALGEIAGGPAIGGVGNLFGVRAALFGSTLILLPVIYLFRLSLRREGQQVQPAPAGLD